MILLILIRYVTHIVKYCYYLQKSADADNLHDSVCEYYSWIDGKFWQLLDQTFTNVFSTFCGFYFIRTFITSVVSL